LNALGAAKSTFTAQKKDGAALTAIMQMHQKNISSKSIQKHERF
jgi:hypothetical protein